VETIAHKHLLNRAHGSAEHALVLQKALKPVLALLAQRSAVLLRGLDQGALDVGAQQYRHLIPLTARVLHRSADSAPALCTASLRLAALAFYRCLHCLVLPVNP
jgi:hypothetical protein